VARRRSEAEPSAPEQRGLWAEAQRVYGTPRLTAKLLRAWRLSLEAEAEEAAAEGMENGKSGATQPDARVPAATKEPPGRIRFAPRLNARAAVLPPPA
jgi:hypothetical protein